MLILLITFFVLAAALAWTMHREAFSYRLEREKIVLKKVLPRTLRILHLSDTHFYGTVPEMDRFFDRLAREEFDYVFITGDIIDTAAGIPSCLENLSKLRSREGVFAVLGNHDHFDYHTLDVMLHNFPGQTYPSNIQRTDLLLEGLRNTGVQVLENEHIVRRDGDSILCICGVGDMTSGKAKLRQTLEGVPDNSVRLLLTHTVDIFRRAHPGEIDISFSGHSHGGQVRLPLYGPLIPHTRLGRSFSSGTREYLGAVCCISRGLGTSRKYRFRLLCPPHAVVYTVQGN